MAPRLRFRNVSLNSTQIFPLLSYRITLIISPSPRLNNFSLSTHCFHRENACRWLSDHPLGFSSAGIEVQLCSPLLVSWVPSGPHQDEQGRMKVMAGQRRAGASLTCLPRLVHTCRAAGLSVTHTKAIKQDSRSVWHCSVPTSKCQSIEAWHSHHSLRAWLAEPDWRHYSPARISTPPIRILLGQV